MVTTSPDKRTNFERLQKASKRCSLVGPTIKRFAQWSNKIQSPFHVFEQFEALAALCNLVRMFIFFPKDGGTCIAEDK